jgi:hypothetical protein
VIDSKLQPVAPAYPDALSQRAELDFAAAQHVDAASAPANALAPICAVIALVTLFAFS